jgi:hypothetical protein
VLSRIRHTGSDPEVDAPYIYIFSIIALSAYPVFYEPIVMLSVLI